MPTVFTIPWEKSKLHLFQQRLLQWYATHARDLPWRQTGDPYKIWVSEIMLQQTRTAAVIPYYQRFIKRFPNIRILALAEIEEVLPFWSGLGYYRRVRDFHRAARTVIHQHKGKIPRDRAELLALPGIGAYTVGAILSLAYGMPEPIVDGNIIRVFCRLFGIGENPYSRNTLNKLWQIAAWMLPSKQSSSFNQALMELGAICCLRHSPQCPLCPVRTTCIAKKQRRQALLPLSRSQKGIIRQSFIIVVIYYCRRILLLKKEKGALISGLWELPSFSWHRTTQPDPALLTTKLKTLMDLNLAIIHWAGRTRHSIMRRQIQLEVFGVQLQGKPVVKFDPSVKLVWILPEEISEYGVSSLSLKSLLLWQKNFTTREPPSSPTK